MLLSNKIINSLQRFVSLYDYSCVKLPEYIKLFEGSRIRNCHLNVKCSVSTNQSNRSAANRNIESLSKEALSNTFFYRVTLSWNKLTLSLREIVRASEFKQKLLEHLWRCDTSMRHKLLLSIWKQLQEFTNGFIQTGR